MEVKEKDFPEIITLCGSTKFKKEYMETMRKLTLKGKIVIPVRVFAHSKSKPITKEEKKMLDELHLRKIDLSDTIYVINPGGYMGESTKKEIMYVRKNGKNIKFLCDKNARNN